MTTTTTTNSALMLDLLATEVERWKKAKRESHAEMLAAHKANDERKTIEWLIRYDLIARTVALAEASAETLKRRHAEGDK